MTYPVRPRVSVIIPVHNTGRFLEESIGSIFAQTLSQDLIWIVAVDDGSTDDSPAILQRLADGHPNMVVIRQEASGSAGSPRNAGIEASRGDYLFFLDSDDRLDPDALARLVDLADETGSGLVLPRLTTFGSSRPRASGTVKDTQKAVHYVKSRAYRTGSAFKLYRASIVRDGNLRFPTGLRIGEDLPFTYTVGLRSPHVSMLGDKPYYFVRWRKDRTSLRQGGQTTDEVLLKNVTVITTILRECHDRDDRIVLLQRSVLGRGGLWVAFAHPRVDEWDQLRRRQAFDQAHEVLRCAWRPEFRRSGTLEAHVMICLILSGDYEGSVQLAREIENGGGLAIREAGLFRRSPRYISSTGFVVRDAVVRSELRPRRRLLLRVYRRRGSGGHRQRGDA